MFNLSWREEATVYKELLREETIESNEPMGLLVGHKPPLPLSSSIYCDFTYTNSSTHRSTHLYRPEKGEREWDSPWSAKMESE